MGDVHLKVGGFIIDGIKYSFDEAVQYLMSIGFSRKEVTEFLKAIPEET